MFGRLGRVVVHNPWKVIAAWVVAVIAVVSLAPSLDDVTSSDQASFLPDDYESVQAQQLADEEFDEAFDSTATMVFTRTDGGALTAADQDTVTGIADELRAEEIDRVLAVATGPEMVSPNEQVQLVSIGLQGLPDDLEVTDAVQQVRDLAGPLVADTGLRVGVAGDAAMMLDNQDAFETALLVVGIATIVLIIGLLLLIYRSPVAALLPVVSVGLVSAVSPALIAVAAKAFDLEVDQSLETILTVVLYGIGTDYILFLMFRYRERLRAGDDPRQAMVTSVARVGEAIASAAGAVIVAFLALLLAVFQAFTSLGPALAIAVAVMLVAALTLVPAIVSLLGPKVFWPSKSWQRIPKGALFQRLGGLTGRRPAVVAVASGTVLVGLALGSLAMNTNYDQLSQLPDDTESARAFEDLQTGFPPGALNPTTVYLRSDDGTALDEAAVTEYAQRLSQTEGVDSVMPASDGTPATYTADGDVAQIDLLLEASPYSNAALDAADGPVRDMTHEAAPEGTTALLGGVTPAFAEIREANARDLSVIFPVAGLLIAVILGLLLRSVVAPIYLLAAVVLSFAATLGSSVLVFQGIGDEIGLSFSLPIILYLFVVAIGTDYNILMVARLREEAREGNDPRRAADLAVEHAGPSVAAAGLILAGTFASLLLSGIAFLTEMGFAVSTGIVLSAFVMSMFLVPSITALIGHRAWWPGHADRRTGPPPADPASPREAATVGTP